MYIMVIIFFLYLKVIVWIVKLMENLEFKKIFEVLWDIIIIFDNYFSLIYFG